MKHLEKRTENSLTAYKERINRIKRENSLLSPNRIVKNVTSMSMTEPS